MKVDKNFVFLAGLTRDSYPDKKTAKACLTSAGAKAVGMDKMSFDTKSLRTVDSFTDNIMNGHCFCNLFHYDPEKKYRKENTNPNVPAKYTMEYPEYKLGPNKGFMKIGFKSDEYFYGSYCVSVDVDKTSFKSMGEYIDRLSRKPTLGYYTYSDTADSRKFRLIYVFDTILDDESFYRISKSIHSLIEDETLEKMDDNCGTRPSQYFNGTNSSFEPYKSYIIYNELDFASEGAEEGTEIVKKLMEKATPTVSQNLASDMERLDYDEFMHSHSKRFRYWYRVEKNEWIEGKFQYVDKDYFSLYYNVSKLKDGMCRRKKLFWRMCLRRIISRNATPDEILFNAYVDLVKFVDNSEDPITIADLVRNVNSCFKYTVEELEDKFKFVLKAAREATKPKNGKIYRNRISVKDSNQFEISMFYVPELSVKENQALLAENGVNVSLTTLYSYAKDNGIQTKRHSDEELLSMIDFSASLRKNQQTLKEQGIEVSIGKISKIMAKATENQE